ncbi:MAG: hypothetical protein PHN39_03170 [Candidatus Pacebacteria bacterium]|nr:hypothetical protein [Candidatus Paceibacterota bacterium]
MNKKVMNLFKSAKEEIRPPEEWAKRLVADLPQSPIEAMPYRYIAKEQGRSHFYKQLLSFMNWRVLAPMAVISLAIIMSGTWLLNKGSDTVVAPGESSRALSLKTSNQVIATPESITDNIIALAEGEQAIVAEESADANLMGIEAQLLNEFSQTYDENQF